MNETWNCIVEKLKTFNKKKKESVNKVLYTFGNVEDNSRELICPRCRTKYIGTHLCNASNYNCELNMKKVGLYDNPLEYKNDDNNTYYCLCCGYGWTKL